MLSIRMFCLDVAKLERKGGGADGRKETHAKRGQGADGVPTRILHERAWDDLERIRDGTERARLDARHPARARVQADGDGHLDCAAARHERGVEDDVARDGHGVGQVPVDLVQDVLGRPAEEDRACLWGRAFRQEGEVSVGQIGMGKGCEALWHVEMGERFTRRQSFRR